MTNFDYLIRLYFQELSKLHSEIFKDTENVKFQWHLGYKTTINTSF